MVVFVDYEQNSYDEVHHRHPESLLHPFADKGGLHLVKSCDRRESFTHGGDSAVLLMKLDANENHSLSRDSPNLNALSRCLACYPIIRELACYLDLNTLDALSRSCRQIRANVLPYNRQLIARSLRCEMRYHYFVRQLEHFQNVPSQIARETAARLSRGENIENIKDVVLPNIIPETCPRDMVEACQRCSKFVCRNCVEKRPNRDMYIARLRRLCKACRTAPLNFHLYPSHKISGFQSEPAEQNTHPRNVSIVAHRFCQCEERSWFCSECRHTLSQEDSTYQRVWIWRTRYGASLGIGLGTGIGEGYQGVKCGRGKNCLAAQSIEVEIDCDVDDKANIDLQQYDHDLKHSETKHGTSPPPPHDDLKPSSSNEGFEHHLHDDEPGYLRQEIVGIGGVVKQKVKKRVMVGACVDCEIGKYLQHESSGRARSWCGWCSKIVPSQQDWDLGIERV